MKILETMLLAVAMMLPSIVAAQDAAPAPPADATAIALQLLDRLDAHDYAAAETAFGAQMAAAVPADKLQQVWESLPQVAGDATGRGEPLVAAQDGVQVVTIPLHYARAELVARVVVAADGSVAGFMVQPPAAPAAPPPPADANFGETDFSVGEGERALPGTLATPKAAPPAAGFPAVVLVHGSGPQDRDESIGPNKPFLDIARGLAAQGIAVLRYEKRTKARPQDFAAGGVTIDSETTDDAVAAVEALRKAPGIDPSRVFVLGHSQGAMMAPRIAQHSGHVAGLILLAAPARPLLDILVEQRKRMAVLDDGRTSAEESAALEALKQQVAAVRASADVPVAQSPMGQPAAYWRSTDAVDPVAEARAVGLPMLVLQGTRDIQVVDADWQGWKGAFHDDPNVEFKLYEGLNHLGIAVQGDDDVAAYAAPGHVDAQLVSDAAAWLGAH
ncbi:alpha/beta fold hydrolase [Luteimonas sp. 50]|uniref:Alpha/beta fold hydrolase n=1 Tax=Cognatiluteimonas sedimenti TaxID=2927791 RepID=A0ABT0A500_9GAMM|nr:alpha/beta fold hydrolase [Lysobacter sedimenti]MCJ0826065.1 alpha/beta fold hydrolase [Lysobacter sedimenti]